MSTYTEEMVNEITNIIGGAIEATADQITAISEAIDMKEKSVGAKLRSMGISTPKKENTASFTEAETTAFSTLVSQGLNAQEIADSMGKSRRQVYGKALSMKLHVEAPEKQEYVKTFSEADEAVITTMVESNSFIEDIASALGKEVPQIRGKLLSMSLKAPQRESKAKVRTVVYTDEIIASVVAAANSGSTAEEISTSLNLNIRGVKSRIGKLARSGEIHTLPSDMGSSKAKGLVDYTDELIASMKELSAQGFTSAAAAEELDIPVASLRSKSGRLGIKYAKAEAAK